MRRSGSRAPYPGADAGYARARGGVSRVRGAVAPVGRDLERSAGSAGRVGEPLPVAADPVKHKSKSGVRNEAEARAILVGIRRGGSGGPARGGDAAPVE